MNEGNSSLPSPAADSEGGVTLRSMKEESSSLGKEGAVSTRWWWSADAFGTTDAKPFEDLELSPPQGSVSLRSFLDVDWIIPFSWGGRDVLLFVRRRGIIAGSLSLTAVLATEGAILLFLSAFNNLTNEGMILAPSPLLVICWRSLVFRWKLFPFSLVSGVEGAVLFDGVSMDSFIKEVSLFLCFAVGVLF